MGGADAVAALAHVLGELAQVGFARFDHGAGAAGELHAHQPHEAEELGQQDRPGVSGHRRGGLQGD